MREKGFQSQSAHGFDDTNTLLGMNFQAISSFHNNALNLKTSFFLEGGLLISSETSQLFGERLQALRQKNSGVLGGGYLKKQKSLAKTVPHSVPEK